jgi:hypothetical protein
MGYYVNPSSTSKETWLQENGTKVPDVLKFDEKPGYRPVCLVDNGPFTAAGICYDDRELDAFKRPDDWRPKQWFMVPINKLLEICPAIAGRVG